MPASTFRILLFIVIALVIVRLVLTFLRKSRGSLSMEAMNELKQKGALVLDVRTRAEYGDGHVAGSLNIPLNELRDRLKELDPARPILACCASGTRSGQAKRILESAGFSQVHNVGPWRNAM